MKRSPSLKARLAAVFIVLGLLCLIIAGVGMKALQTANARAQHIYDTLTLPGQAYESSYILNLVSAMAAMESAGAPDPAARKGGIDFIGQIRKQAAVQFDLFKNSPKDDAIKDISAQIEKDQAKFDEVFPRLVNAIEQGDTAGAMAIEGSELHPAGAALFEEAMQMHKLLGERAKAHNEAGVADYERMMMVMIALLVIGGLAAGVYGWVQLRLVVTSIGGLRETLQRVSETLDLTHRAPVKNMDEIGVTSTAFNHLMDRVSDVMQTVHDAAESVNSASSELSAGNVDLSSRTEEQAASLEQAAASMDELTGTVRQNAENARQASSLAANAADTANRGNEVVAQAVGTMRDLSESSAKIADITGIIEGIAFQTNILALNAAVEAARAGDQGRGFAVVAGEVRALAQRSAAAAKEIKELIDTSVSTSARGSDLVNHAGESMGEIIAAVTRVTDIMGEIAAASEEQSRGIDQVSQAVTQMDQMTQQNAALVEEASAATHSMHDQAGRLKSGVETFKFAKHGSQVSSGSRLSAAVSASATARSERRAPVKSQTTAAARDVKSAAVPAPRVAASAPARVAASAAVPAASASRDADTDWETF